MVLLELNKNNILNFLPYEKCAELVTEFVGNP